MSSIRPGRIAIVGLAASAAAAVLADTLRNAGHEVVDASEAPSPVRHEIVAFRPTLAAIARGVDPEIAAWNAAVDRKKAERRGRR